MITLSFLFPPSLSLSLSPSSLRVSILFSFSQLLTPSYQSHLISGECVISVDNEVGREGGNVVIVVMVVVVGLGACNALDVAATAH